MNGTRRPTINLTRLIEASVAKGLHSSQLAGSVVDNDGGCCFSMTGSAFGTHRARLHLCALPSTFGMILLYPGQARRICGSIKESKGIMLFQRLTVLIHCYISRLYLQFYQILKKLKFYDNIGKKQSISLGRSNKWNKKDCWRQYQRVRDVRSTFCAPLFDRHLL